jgi:hypothetical protein
MTPSSNGHQTNLFGNDLLQQLDPQDPHLVLVAAIPWKTFELEFTLPGRYGQITPFGGPG